MSSTPQWYMAIGGQQVGPVGEQDVVAAIQGGSADADTLVFVAGMPNWTPLREVPKFQPYLAPAAPKHPADAPAHGVLQVRQAPEIDYRIVGEDLQFVEVELDPGEAAVGEAGSLMCMDAGISMDTIFGDSSAQESGVWGKLLGAGRRLITGESLFTTVYTNQSSTKRRVAFAAPPVYASLPRRL